MNNTGWKTTHNQKTANTKVIESYQILELLGRGASGVVYKGINLTNGCFVAMKEMQLGRAEVKIIKSQINFLKQLNHPNIIKYLDAVQKESKIYLILEYMQQGSLANLVKRSPFSQNIVKIYAKQILQGLKYLHEIGIVHRDIKGANILVTKQGVIKLADFGVAVKVNETQKTLSAAGTPYWMAPQIIIGEVEVSTKCDIWSLGCTIIELLTGNPPYHDLLQFPALFRIVEDQFPPIPQVTQQCRQLLIKCFIKNPKLRPEAAQLLNNVWIQSAIEETQVVDRFQLEVIEQMLMRADYHRLQEVVIKLPNRRSLYCHSKFILINRQPYSNEKIKFIIELISNDYEALKYLSQISIIKKSIPQTLTKQIDQPLCAFLVEEICRLCCQYNDITVFLQCLPLIKNILMHGTQSKDKITLSRIINGLHSIVFQDIITCAHLFVIMGNDHIVSYLIMCYVAMIDCLQTEISILILEILGKASEWQSEQMLGWFEGGVRHLVRIDVTINHIIICFHNLRVLQNISKNEQLSFCMEREGAVFYICQFLGNFDNQIGQNDSYCLLMQLFKYITNFILPDINRKLQFKKHKGVSLIKNIPPIFYREELKQIIIYTLQSLG